METSGLFCASSDMVTDIQSLTATQSKQVCLVRQILLMTHVVHSQHKAAYEHNISLLIMTQAA